MSQPTSTASSGQRRGSLWCSFHPADHWTAFYDFTFRERSRKKEERKTHKWILCIICLILLLLMWLILIFCLPPSPPNDRQPTTMTEGPMTHTTTEDDELTPKETIPTQITTKTTEDHDSTLRTSRNFEKGDSTELPTSTTATR
ncbi:uncharacterized protein LOC144108200 [Amblyomma americanum]